jgi:cyclophilin family peptidyl-prolyl cis-trans isomerase
MNKELKRISLAALAALAVASYASSAAAQTAPPPGEPNPVVLLRTTKGDVYIELFEDRAPNTVANFISLVDKKFYDGLKFHRVIDGFMTQGGCPKGDGTGGPGYSIPCECYGRNPVKHARGSLSMAHAGRDTGGSQFFITFKATAFLDGKHTVFGQVVQGMDVVDRFQRIDPDKLNPYVQPDKIVEARVVRRRNHPYVPQISQAPERYPGLTR